MPEPKRQTTVSIPSARNRGVRLRVRTGGSVSKDDRDVKKTIALVFYYYTQRPIEDMALQAYYRALADLDPNTVVAAYEGWMRDPGKKRFPLPGEIRSELSPMVSDEGQARDAAARVLGAVAKFGSYRPTDARAHVGELGWEAMIRMFGNWESLCADLTTKQVPTMNAQLRDLCLAILEQGRKRAGAPALPEGVRPSQLEYRAQTGSQSPAGFRSVGDLLNSMPIDAKKPGEGT